MNTIAEMIDQLWADDNIKLQQKLSRIQEIRATPEGQAYFAEQDRLEREKEEEEQRQRHERYRRALLVSCGMPLRIRETIGGELEETKAVTRVRRWLEERKADASKWCLVLSADKGCGKSIAAGLWLRETGVEPVTFWNTKSESDDRATSWWPIAKFARIESFNGEFDAVCAHPGPIVIDDLGSEYLDGKGWFLQALDAFIDARYSEYRPTLITTNLDADAFKARYSERVADRIREGGCFYEFKGESLRQRKAANQDGKRSA